MKVKSLSKVISVLLALIMVLGMLPLTAFAESTENRIMVAGVKMKKGEYLASGAAAVTNTKPDEATGYAYLSDWDYLYLVNFSYSGENDGISVFGDGLVHISYSGKNTISCSGDGNGVYAGTDTSDLRFIRSGKYSTLKITGATMNAIYCSGNLTFDNGGGGITLETAWTDCYCIYVEGELKIINKADAMYDTENKMELKPKNSFGIRAIGDITVSGSRIKLVSEGSKALNGGSIFSSKTITVEKSSYLDLSCDNTEYALNAMGDIFISDSIVKAKAKKCAISKAPDLSGFNSDVVVFVGEYEAVSEPVNDLETAYYEKHYVKIGPATNSFPVFVAGVQMEKDMHLISSPDGSAKELVTRGPGGGVGYARMLYAETLILENYEYDGPGHSGNAVHSYADDLQVIFKGESKLGSNTDSNVVTGIYAEGEMTVSGEKLTLNTVTYGIVGKEKLTLANCQDLSVHASYGVTTNDKKSFCITDSQINIVSSNQAMNSKPSFNYCGFGYKVYTAENPSGAYTEVTDFSAQYQKARCLKTEFTSTGIYVGGVEMVPGKYLQTKSGEPTAADLKTMYPDSYPSLYAYLENSSTLVLNNYTYQGAGKTVNGHTGAVAFNITKPAKLIVKGESKILQQGSQGNAIYTRSALTVEGGSSEKYTKLTLKGVNGIYAHGNGSTLEFKGLNLDVTARSGKAFTCSSSSNSITFTECDVAAKAGGETVFEDFKVKLVNTHFVGEAETSVFQYKPDFSGSTYDMLIKAGGDRESAVEYSENATYHNKKYVEISPDALDVWVGGVRMAVGKYFAGDKETSLDLTDTEPTSYRGYAYMQSEDTLVLHNLFFSVNGYDDGYASALIYANNPDYKAEKAKLNIVIEGYNSISCEDDYAYDGVYADNVDISFTGKKKYSDELHLSDCNTGINLVGNPDMGGSLEVSTCRIFVSDGDIICKNNITVDNAEIISNSDGGGISAVEGSITVNRSRIRLTRDDNSGISAGQNITITDNSEVDCEGEAAYGLSCVNLLVDNSKLSAEAGESEYNAVYASTIVVENNSVFKATAYNGNGIKVDYSLHVTDSEIYATGIDSGEAITNDALHCVYTDNEVTIENSKASFIGGRGIYGDSDTCITVRNSSMKSNKIELDDDSSITFEDSDIEITTNYGKAMNYKPTLNYSRGYVLKAGTKDALEVVSKDSDFQNNTCVSIELVRTKSKINVTGGYAENDLDDTVTEANDGETIWLIAKAPEGKKFVKWVIKSGGITLSNENYSVTSFTMGMTPVSVEAIFEAIPDYAFNVTVTNGTASPTTATKGTKVTITANAAPTGKVFDGWVVKAGGVTLANANATTTTFTMPDKSVTVEATYRAATAQTYGITVTNGTSTKAKAAKGETVTITANAPSKGYAFDKWVVKAGGVTLANANADTTSFKMGDKAVSIEATYKFVAYGNVDGEGEGEKAITAADARLCLRAAVGLEVYAEGSYEYLACDVDGEPKITASDARLVLRRAVGLDKSFPVEDK